VCSTTAKQSKAKGKNEDEEDDEMNYDEYR